MDIEHFIDHLFFMVIGAVGTYVLSRYIIETKRFQRSAIRVEGKVSRVVKLSDPRGDVWRRYVQFETADGEIIEFAENQTMVYEGNHLGKSVMVAYDPKKPSRARIDKTASLWFLPVIGLGVFFLSFVFGCLKLLGF